MCARNLEICSTSQRTLNIIMSSLVLAGVAAPPAAAQTRGDSLAIMTLVAHELTDTGPWVIDAERWTNPALTTTLADIVGRPLAGVDDSVAPACTDTPVGQPLGSRVTLGAFEVHADTIVDLWVHHRCWTTLPEKARRILNRERLLTGRSTCYRFRKERGEWSFEINDIVDVN